MLLRRAIEQGISYIDTAAAYGDAEIVLGGLSGFIMTNGVRLCTKMTAKSRTDTVKTLEDKVQASLSRLQANYVDTLLLHSATTEMLFDSAVSGAMRAAKQRGLARLTGASSYGLEVAGLALALDWCDVIQVEYSILNQQVLPEIVRSKKPSQELVVRSVLCKGLLTARRKVAVELSRPIAATLDDLDRLALEWGYTLPELAIRFALDTPGVDVALVGISTAEELDTALRARARRPLAQDQLQILAEFDRSELDAVHPELWNHIAAN
jgi:aryl-alcohol dehydrogenase-like predicted oxidoreductase